jgi:hypothetical protein
LKWYEKTDRCLRFLQSTVATQTLDLAAFHRKLRSAIG